MMPDDFFKHNAIRGVLKVFWFYTILAFLGFLFVAWRYF